jgi:hypothetical protein
MRLAWAGRIFLGDGEVGVYRIGIFFFKMGWLLWGYGAACRACEVSKPLTVLGFECRVAWWTRLWYVFGQ